MMRDSRTVKDIHGTGIDTFIPAHDSYDLLDLLGTEINAGVIDFEGNFKLKELKGLHYEDEEQIRLLLEKDTLLEIPAVQSVHADDEGDVLLLTVDSVVCTPD